MKVKMLKNVDWCVDYKKKKLEEGRWYEFEEYIAEKMIISGYATKLSDKPKRIQKKELVQENKSLDVPENKEFKKKKKKNKK